jgi:site-specific recombinase XerD
MTKNGKPRNAFIIGDVRKSLLRLKELRVNPRAGKDKTDDLVFSMSENKKWWAAALEDAGIENYTWHDNRHTFCSSLVQAGVHLKIAQEAAGHASIAICPLRPQPGRGCNGGPQLGEPRPQT